jgi:23S rRNA (uracil1939-C5)-methyltransferase
LTIEKLAFGGAGFGHLDGKACFVPFTAPGDRARVKTKSEKRSYLECDLVELVSPSPLRTSPQCPVFGSCGGCNWQHISYEEQLRAKEEIFAEVLWRSARVEREKIEHIIPSPDPYGYRSRVQLKIRSIGGRVHMGFYRPGTHFVVDIPDKCTIANAKINALLEGLRRIVSSCPEPDKIPQIDVAVGEDNRAELVVHYIGDRVDEIVHQLSISGGSLADTGIFLQRGRKSTLAAIDKGNSTPLIYSLTGSGTSAIRMEFCHGGFSQVNYRQNRVIAETVLKWAQLTGNEKVLDLYCGNGNFTIPLSGKSASILGIEEYPPSIESSRRNSEANGAVNALYECSEVVQGIENLIDKGEKFDLVLLDPPRSGAKEAVQLIPELLPKRIIYVSCDPATLARDLSSLKKKGYSVLVSQPVDMFPQTYHIESITLLAGG